MGSKNNSNVRDYLSYPKQFLPYKWFKPILVAHNSCCRLRIDLPRFYDFRKQKAGLVQQG